MPFLRCQTSPLPLSQSRPTVFIQHVPTNTCASALPSFTSPDFPSATPGFPFQRLPLHSCPVRDQAGHQEQQCHRRGGSPDENAQVAEPFMAQSVGVQP